MMQTINSSSPRGTMLKLEDIVFTETDACWVHRLNEESLVITTKIANSLIHQVLIESGSTFSTRMLIKRLG